MNHDIVSCHHFTGLTAMENFTAILNHGHGTWGPALVWLCIPSFCPSILPLRDGREEVQQNSNNNNAATATTTMIMIIIVENVFN